MNDPLKKYVTRHREDFDHLEPPKEILGSVLKSLNTEKKVPKKIFSHMKYYGMAASILLLVSVSVYIISNKEEVLLLGQKETISFPTKLHEKAIQKEESYAQTNVSTTNETGVNLRRSVSAKKRIRETKVTNFSKKNTSKTKEREEIFRLLADDDSAGNRISGLIKAGELSFADHKMVDALRKSAMGDPNSNVRLAAVEALAAHSGESYAVESIAKSFIGQDDAVVQADLIGIIAKIDGLQDNKEVRQKLLELTRNPATQIFVKDEAYAMLLKTEF